MLIYKKNEKRSLMRVIIAHLIRVTEYSHRIPLSIHPIGGSIYEPGISRIRSKISTQPRESEVR